MAATQLLLPSPIVKMDNALARAQWPDGGQYDLDLIMHIASKIRVDDEDFATYRFPVSELGYGSRLDGRTYQRVKAALERLSKGSIKVDGKRDNFYFYSLFSMTGYEDGEIIVRFDPELKPFFLHLTKHFTSFELFEMRMLPSEYSKRLFILLKSYSSMDMVKVGLADLHNKLLTPESFKTNFKDFRRRVLDKAHADLEGVLPFEWEPVKKGRAVTAINFIFNRAKVFETRKQKAIETRQKESKAATSLIRQASQCAISKDFSCVNQDNKKKVCNACKNFELCTPSAKRAYENGIQQGLIKK